MELCLEIYNEKFPIFSLTENNLEELIERCIISENEKNMELLLPKKIEYFYLIRFFNNSAKFFNNLFNEYKVNPKNQEAVKLSEICELLSIANQEFDIDYKKSEEIFKNNFPINEDCHLNFKNFMEFFRQKRKIKIRICDYIESTIDLIINMYKFVEEILIDFLINCKEMANNILLMKDFETVVFKLIPNFENKMFLNDYFM